MDCRAGLVKRASVKLRNNGLEGIHCTLQNPVYYGNKYLTCYLKFFQIVIKSVKTYKSTIVIDFLDAINYRSVLISNI